MDKVSEKIISDANIKSTDIEAQCRENEEKIKGEHKKEIDRIKSDQNCKLEEIYRAEFNRITAGYNLELRRGLLNFKRGLIDEILEEVRSKIKDDMGTYLIFLEKMICKGVRTGKEEIIVRDEDRMIIDEEFLKKVNDSARVIVASNTDLRLSDETRELHGGLILKEGKVEFNSELDVVIDFVFKNYEEEIVKMLF